MKFERLLVLFFALVFSIGSVLAAPPGKPLEYAGGPLGKVIFDGKVHADKGLKCPECHTNPKLFAMKKGTDKMTMADLNAGKFCGTCHNGKKAFATKDAASCAKCHKK